MSTSKTWPGGATNTSPASYSLPAVGELNWTSLPGFLLALADSAQCTTFQKWAVRKATTTPVTVVATSDCVVVTDLASAGAVTVNLPAGADKQVYVIVDGKGDASTNNITINRNGSDTIKGATTLVLNRNRSAVVLIYNAADTDWKVVGPILVTGTINLASDVTGTLPIANGGTNATSLAAGAAYSTGTALATEAQLAISRGGTNASSLSAGAAYSTGTALATEAQLAISRGGTNASSLSAGAAYSTGTALATEAQLAVTRGGTGQSTAIAAFDALNPTTTKGDLVAHDGSTSTRLAVGTDGQVLTADAASTNGIKWAGAAAVPGTAGIVYTDASTLQSTNLAFASNGNKVAGVNSAGTNAELKAFAVGTSGTDFAIAHSSGTITFNLPDASATARGLITTGTQFIAGAKTFTSQFNVQATANMRTISPEVDNTYDLGTSAVGWANLYLSNGSGNTAKIVAPSLSSDITITLPSVGSTLATLGANTFTGVQSFSSGVTIGGNETLSTYDEGTWTVGRAFTTSDGDSSVTAQVGKYVRIGSCVYITFSVSITKGTASGSLKITGLPFTSASGHPGGISFKDFTGMGASTVGMTGEVIASSTTIDIFYNSSGAATPLSTTQLGATFVIEAFGFYFV